MEIRVEEQYLIPRLIVLFVNDKVMEFFGPFFVDVGTLICLDPEFF